MYQLSTRHGDSFNSLVDELFADFFHRANVPAARHSNTQAVSRARMDVLDKGGNFEVKVDLPGIRKDDIHVGIEGARVSINAESKDSSETKKARERGQDPVQRALYDQLCTQLRTAGRSHRRRRRRALRRRRTDAVAAEARTDDQQAYRGQVIAI